MCLFNDVKSDFDITGTDKPRKSFVKDAVPTIFPCLPVLLQPVQLKPRRPLKRKNVASGDTTKKSRGRCRRVDVGIVGVNYEESIRFAFL